MDKKKRRLSWLFCSLLGLGYIKRGPATAGAIAGAVIFYFTALNGAWLTAAVLLLLLLTGVFASSVVSREEKLKDPQFVIIDEVVGCGIALFLLPRTLVIYAAAVLIFRAFDKTKILGIKKFEALPSGWGIMMDDLVAGIYSNLLLRILIYAYERIA